jgi:hypothetical protein
VAEVVEGFETPFGMELLATVHWVAKHADLGSKESITAAVHTWSERKSMFKPPHIAAALAQLERQGWISPLSK